MTERLPLIAITPWRRTLPTFVHPKTDLYTLAPYYTDAVALAGGHSAVLPAAADHAAADSLMERFDGLILSGGSDLDPALYDQDNTASFGPDRSADESDARLMSAAMEQGKPVLGICRGAQMANVALGGSLHQNIWDSSEIHAARASTDDPIADAELFLARRHAVDLEPGSTIAKLFDSSSIEANSLHHQAIDRVADGLEVVGRADDGIVEAVEHTDHPLIAVQWHPERLADHHPLFEWLVAEASTNQG